MSLAQRELEKAFETDFLEVHGFPLVEASADEGPTSSRLPSSPFLERRRAAERRELETREQLADMLGVDVEEVL